MTAVTWRTVSTSSAPVSPGATTSSSIGTPSCTSADDRKATLSGKVRPTGRMTRVRGASRTRPKGDARRPRLDRVQPRTVVGGALGEDGHEVALHQGLVALGEGILVSAHLLVLLAAHEHHAGPPEDEADDGQPAQARLGDEARETPEGTGDDQRVDEAVEVVGDQ